MIVSPEFALSTAACIEVKSARGPVSLFTVIIVDAAVPALIKAKAITKQIIMIFLESIFVKNVLKYLFVNVKKKWFQLFFLTKKNLVLNMEHKKVLPLMVLQKYVQNVKGKKKTLIQELKYII